MHAYKYSRACLQTRRVLKVYVAHAVVPTCEGNEDYVQQSGNVANNI